MVFDQRLYAWRQPWRVPQHFRVRTAGTFGVAYVGEQFFAKGLYSGRDPMGPAVPGGWHRHRLGQASNGEWKFV